MISTSHLSMDVNPEQDCNVNAKYSELMSPAEDLEKWFDGEIEGLEDAFKKQLRYEALADLKKPDCYTELQHNSKGNLPNKWHEGHQPGPCFWSEKQWNWFAKGRISVSSCCTS